MVLSDPSIPAATQGLAGAAKRLEGTAANSERLTGYVADMFRPKKLSFWQSVIGFVVGKVAGPGVGALVQHGIPQRIGGTVTVKEAAK